jgi:hypothetical protein
MCHHAGRNPATENTAMRYTRIDLEGSTGNFAVITRKRQSALIEAEVLAPSGSSRHSVRADDRPGQELLAGQLQRALEGYAGTNAEVGEYLDVIKRLAD